MIRIVQGDITDQSVDGIVNAANATLLGGGGVDGAIHRRGGPSILAECRELRTTRYQAGLPTGAAVSTTAGLLPARRVIHTVGPVWHGGGNGEREQLATAYDSCMRVALEEKLRTIAFPSISTGAYGFPVELAAPIALSTVHVFLKTWPESFDEVRFVLFSTEALQVFEAAADGLDVTRDVTRA
jgi:O-acetyl-ADP-ribose deacetylase